MHIRDLTCCDRWSVPGSRFGVAPLQAQGTNVRFVLDFLLQGQQSAFVLGREKGYYAAQKVNLTAFDPGRGGADSITKVASGTHDIGFGDLSAMIEFNAKNPGQELIAVLLVYEQAPLSLISLKKSNIRKPADLEGRKGGAPTVDATYRLFNVFARVNGSIPRGCSGRTCSRRSASRCSCAATSTSPPPG